MNKIAVPDRRYKGTVISARPKQGDEVWQLSKDSADAATAPQLCGRASLKRKKKAESRP